MEKLDLTFFGLVSGLIFVFAFIVFFLSSIQLNSSVADTKD